MKALFAAELGAGLGHVARLAPWRAALAARGIETLTALPDLRAASDAPLFAGAAFIQGPRLAHGPSLAGFEPVTYADLLVAAGYANPAVLGTLVDAWRTLFDIARADAIVADHAPTALLAARIAGLPILHVGDGFTIPAAGKAVAPFGAGSHGDERRFAATAGHALDTINRVLAARGGPAVEGIETWLQEGQVVLSTYPELDHHGGAHAARSCDGHFGLPSTDAAGWRSVEGPRVFAYLKPGHPHFEAVIGMLGRMAGQVRIHAQGLVRADAPGPALWDWSVVPLPAAAMAGCDLVVCHAGHGSVCEALLAGRPLLLLPQVHEQVMTARNVATLGAGAWVHPAQDARALRRGLRDALDGGGARAAAGFAARYAGQDRAARLAECADRFLALVRRETGPIQ